MKITPGRTIRRRTSLSSSVCRLTLLVSLVLLRGYSVQSQNVTHIYKDVGFIGASTICPGDTVTLIAALNCVCGYPQWINTRDVYTGSCNWQCQVQGISTPTFQGPAIIWQSTPPASYDCNGPGYEPRCKVVPMQEAVYTISWEKTHVVDDIYCGPYFYPSSTTIWHYSGQVVVGVDEVPEPTLTTDKTTVKPGETFTLTVPNCEADGQTPDFSTYLKETCQTGNGSWNICWNNSFQFTAPNYSTTLAYRARLERTDPWWCKSQWSEPVEITVEESPNPNACNDPDIQALEALLGDENNFGRSDYHDYVVDNLVCETGSSGPRPCNVGSVWSFLKSSTDYQAPVKADFPLGFSPLAMIDRLLGQPISVAPATLQNCQTLNLPLAHGRASGIAMLGLATDGQTGTCPSTPISLSADPIRVVVDESSRCVTNYTKPGHILHPGKVRRCVYVGACGDIRIKTTGSGFHQCGSNATGLLMAVTNEIFGASIFNNIDGRLIYNFQH